MANTKIALQLTPDQYDALTLEVEYAKGMANILRDQIGDEGTLEQLTAVNVLRQKLALIDRMLEGQGG